MILLLLLQLTAIGKVSSLTVLYSSCLPVPHIKYSPGSYSCTIKIKIQLPYSYTALLQTNTARQLDN